MASRIIAALLLRITAALPVRTGRWLAEKCGLLLYCFPAVRRALLDNAAHILGADSPPSRRRGLSRAVLRNFGRSIHDLLAAHRQWKNIDELPLRVDGREHFEGLASSGKGFLAVSLHMGSYEIGSMILAQKSPRTSIVYHRDPAGFFEALRSRQRRQAGLGEFPIDGSSFFGIDLMNHLRGGGTLLIAGEIDAFRKGERFPFLEGEAKFSLWPAHLAMQAGVPILPAFTVRESDGSYCLYIEKPLDAGSALQPRGLMEHLVKIFEKYVRKYPEQWLMVRPFWVKEMTQ